MAVYLVVANQTLGGEQLEAALEERARRGPAAFRFVVPVTEVEGTHQWDYPPIDRVIPDAHKIARVLAEGRLEHELGRLEHAGMEASGEVVDLGVVTRVRETVAAGPVDEIVIATLPRRLSRWLVADLPHRISRATSVPVTVIESSPGPSL